MAKSHLKLVTPATVNRTVTPKRLPNSKLRTREYLTETEVERLMNAARKNRWGHRDVTMVLVAYRHGFRAAELVDLRWSRWIQGRYAARAPAQAGDPKHPPDPRGRTSGTTAASARTGAQIALRVHIGARCTFQHRRLCSYRRTGRKNG